MLRKFHLHYTLFALFWMALIFWFSDQPKLFYLPDSLLDTLFKKSAHAFAYGVLWFLWWRATGHRTWMALAITVLYAMSDEYHQTFVPGRHGQLFDVGVDTFGALLAIAITRSPWGKRVSSAFWGDQDIRGD